MAAFAIAKPLNVMRIHVPIDIGDVRLAIRSML